MPLKEDVLNYEAAATALEECAQTLAAKTNATDLPVLKGELSAYASVTFNMSQSIHLRIEGLIKKGKERQEEEERRIILSK